MNQHDVRCSLVLNSACTQVAVQHLLLAVGRFAYSREHLLQAVPLRVALTIPI